MSLTESFRVYERGMAERGSGLTQDQTTGATVALIWAEREVVAALKQEVEAATKDFQDEAALRLKETAILAAELTRLRAELATTKEELENTTEVMKFCSEHAAHLRQEVERLLELSQSHVDTICLRNSELTRLRAENERLEAWKASVIKRAARYRCDCDGLADFEVEHPDDQSPEMEGCTNNQAELVRLRAENERLLLPIADEFGDDWRLLQAIRTGQLSRCEPTHATDRWEAAVKEVINLRTRIAKMVRALGRIEIHPDPGEMRLIAHEARKPS